MPLDSPIMHTAHAPIGALAAWAPHTAHAPMHASTGTAHAAAHAPKPFMARYSWRALCSVVVSSAPTHASLRFQASRRAEQGQGQRERGLRASAGRCLLRGGCRRHAHARLPAFPGIAAGRAGPGSEGVGAAGQHLLQGGCRCHARARLPAFFKQRGAGAEGLRGVEGSRAAQTTAGACSEGVAGRACVCVLCSVGLSSVFSGVRGSRAAGDSRRLLGGGVQEQRTGEGLRASGNSRSLLRGGRKPRACQCSVLCTQWVLAVCSVGFGFSGF